MKRLLIVSLLATFTTPLMADTPHYVVNTDAWVNYDGDPKDHFIGLNEKVVTHGHYCKLYELDDGNVGGVKLTCIKIAGMKDSDSQFSIMAACDDTQFGYKDDAYLRFTGNNKPAAHFHLTCQTTLK